MSILSSEQLLNHSDVITSYNFKQIYCKLMELQTKITNDTFQLNISQRQELWWNFIELWIELSRKTVDIRIDEQYIVTNCYNIITSLCGQVIFDLTDTKFVEKTFSACLTMLNLPHITRFLSKIDKSFDELIFSSNIHLILSMAIQSARFLSFDTNILLNKQTDLFILLINYTERRIEQHSESLIERILTFFWSISDRTCFVPLLIEIGLSKNIVRWLSSSITRTISKYWMPLISIIYNLSRHDEGVDALNRYETIEIIKYFQNKSINEEISLLIPMILAQLSSPEQHKFDKKIMNNVLNQLLQRTINAARNETLWRDTGFHISEFLSVMVKLFVVEERTLDYILCHAETEPSSDISSTIHLFSSILLSFSDALNKNNPLEQFTLIAILNILWSISFQTQYLQEMIINNKEAILIVENLADNNKVQAIVQYKSRSMEGIHEAAYGIIHNIQKYSQSILNNNSPNLFPKKKPSIMISYSHDDKIFCKKLVDFLLTQQDLFDVWIDQIHCQHAGDIWEMIANGIEQANIIVCLISNYYFQSKSCRQEFIYATDTLHKLIVPVLIESFKPKGWLGIRIPGIKYIRFQNLNQPEPVKMNDLLDTILSTFSIDQQRQSSYLHETSTDHPRLPSNRWLLASNDDIKAWFTHYHISTQLCDLFDFQTSEEMLHYSEQLLRNYDKHLEIYSKAYMKKYNGDELLPHEFQRFAQAMKELLTSNIVCQASS